MKIKSSALLFFLMITLLYNHVLFAQDVSKNERPNIVFIMSDDHAVSAVSAYKDWLSKVAPTPNIDRIANQGMLMHATYNTNSICGPSRAAILTGKYSHVNGFFKNEKGGDFDGSQQTFPKLFQEAGYQTAVIGKWHLGTAPTGFDYSKVMVNHGGQGTYFDPVFVENGKDTIVEKLRHSTAQVAHDALKWLANDRDTSKPFMLMYQFKAPHRPWTPNPKFDGLFAEDLPLHETFNDDYSGRLAASQNMLEIENHMNRKDLKVPPPKDLKPWQIHKYNKIGNQGEFWTPDDTLQGAALKYWKYQRYIKDYLRCVAGVDEAVGQMLDFLEQNGLDKNTIVIYTSDQGFYLGEHGWFDKRWMYEPSFRMPFTIQYPSKIKAGVHNDDLLLNIDFAPTLLDMAGIPIPEDMQGESFKKALIGKRYDSRDAVYYHYYEYPFWHKVQPHYGVSTGKYKLIHFYYDMDQWELFDLENDPNEMNNLYANAAYKEIVQSLQYKINQLQKKYKDDMSLDEMRAMTDVVIKRVYNERTNGN
ncbi:MAG: sulfatase [Flavobacteriaceae bacterium]|nr:sulfatase [Flavobacteriaceae bacterium]MDG2314055.1 sulfatase [Flavobacteriaceae bacterium]